MADIDLGNEDGYVTVAFEGATARLDLFDTHDKICAAMKGREAADAVPAIASLMKSLGLPEPSRRVAVRFANAVMEAVAGLKKNADGPPP
jgi:hypothetical protein